MKYQKDIIISIKENVFEKMKLCVQNAQPNEAFGLIMGPKPKEISLNDQNEFQYHFFGERFECIESSEKSTVSFLMDNTIKLFEIMDNAIKKYNRRILSIFHSHPSGTQPSGVDISYMKFLDNSYNQAYNSKYKVRLGIRNQIWTIMDSSNYNLEGFIYLNNELSQIAIDIKEE